VMMKKVMTLLIVLLMLLAAVGPAVAAGDNIHREEGGGSGEGDPGGGDTSPPTGDNVSIFIQTTSCYIRVFALCPLYWPRIEFTAAPAGVLLKNINTSTPELRHDVRNATGDK